MQIEKLDEKHLRVTVTEGKKNEIRIVLKHIGSPVVGLHRVSYGPIKLNDLKVGKISKIDTKTVDLVIKKLLESK
jgi:16S rRNA U516 pseudouridylate synthase RsuA-like enzyme